MNKKEFQTLLVWKNKSSKQFWEDVTEFEKRFNKKSIWIRIKNIFILISKKIKLWI